MPGGTASARLLEYAPAGAPLRSAYRRKEFVDFELEVIALRRQRLGRCQHLRGGRTGLAGAAVDIADVGGDLRGAFGGLADIAGDLARRRALLLYGRRDGRCDLG